MSEMKDVEFEVRWHPFQLDANAPVEGERGVHFYREVQEHRGTVCTSHIFNMYAMAILHTTVLHTTRESCFACCRM